MMATYQLATTIVNIATHLEKKKYKIGPFKVGNDVIHIRNSKD